MSIINPDGTISRVKGEVASGTDIIDGQISTFPKDVLEESQMRPVLVDFWAPWCGPCKQLTPILESCVQEQQGRVRLVKIDIDKNQAIAAQLQVRSIPTVFGFVMGQPVDGFMGLQSEQSIKDFIKRLLSGFPQGSDQVASVQDQIDAFLKQASKALQDQDGGTAMAAYQQILGLDQTHVGALAGLARCYLWAGQVDQAASLLNELNEEQCALNEVVSVLSAIELAKQYGDEANDPLDTATTDLKDDLNVVETRIRVAKRLLAKGEIEEAFEHLLMAHKLEQEKKDEQGQRQAHALILKLIESIAYDEAKVTTLRRRLSSVLFC